MPLFCTRELVSKSLRAEADLVDHLGEIDERKLYLEKGHPSMFEFCTKEFGFRRAPRTTGSGWRFPSVIAALRSGAVHLSGLRRLVPHVTEGNCERLLAEATGKSKKEIEEIVARIAPADLVRTSIRRIAGCSDQVSTGLHQSSLLSPESMPMLTHAAPKMEGLATAGGNADGARAGTGSMQLPTAPMRRDAGQDRGTMAPLTAEAFKVQFTASREVRDKLVEAQALLAHRVPDGDLAKIIERGIDLLIAEGKRERFGVGRNVRSGVLPRAAECPDDAPAGSPDEPTSRSREAPSRHIPDAIRRAVYGRDGGRCTFVDDRGCRCTSTHALEFDHEEGFARTGIHEVKSIRLRCRAHNQHAADQMYGRAFMDRAHGSFGVWPGGRAASRPGTS